MSKWLDELTEREKKEIALAQVYATEYAHGTTGHNQLMLINKLTSKLTEVESQLNAVYAERNTLVLLAARLCQETNPVINAGVGYDSKEPEWPVVFIDLPNINNGQVSWHLPVLELPAGFLPEYSGVWDGHTTTEKYKRIAEFIHQAYED